MCFKSFGSVTNMTMKTCILMIAVDFFQLTLVLFALLCNIQLITHTQFFLNKTAQGSQPAIIRENGVNIL